MNMKNNSNNLKCENVLQNGFGIEVMKKIVICQQCGTKANKTDNFCINCGKRLVKETIYDHYRKNHLICNCCFTVLTNDKNYCPQCGSKINKEV